MWFLVELGAERLAFQKLHDGVGDAVVLPEIVNRQDVGVGERRDRLRLALERASAPGSAATDSGSTLIATTRSSFSSRARYTSPIPPAPMGVEDLAR